MNLSMIGCGHVGLVSAACFAEMGHRVLGVDSDRAKVAALKRGECPIYEPGLAEILARVRRRRRLSFASDVADAVAFGEAVFISVPTPTGDDGRADMSCVEGVSREIAAALREYRLIVEKSTAPVNTCERIKATIQKYARRGADFDVASNPEFLREGRAIQDTMKPDRVVIGVEAKRAERVLRRLYAPLKAPVLATDTRSAELIKHASNSFLALKISFANAIAAVCEASGANVREVARGMGLDARIGPSFLDAGIGYGGSCFPKDVRAFEAIARQLGYDFPLLREIQRINREARERFLQKVEQELWIVKGKTVAAWGLAFKPDTDDVRESVAVEVVRALAERGAKVKAYDPQAIPTARAELAKTKGISYARSALEAARGADCLLVLTEWEEFRRADLAKLRRAMAHPTILDGRNVFDAAAARQAGFTYRGVGMP